LCSGMVALPKIHLHKEETRMNFSTRQHKHYGGIDLHARRGEECCCPTSDSDMGKTAVVAHHGRWRAIEHLRHPVRPVLRVLRSTPWCPGKGVLRPRVGGSAAERTGAGNPAEDTDAHASALTPPGGGRTGVRCRAAGPRCHSPPACEVGGTCRCAS